MIGLVLLLGLVGAIAVWAYKEVGPHGFGVARVSGNRVDLSTELSRMNRRVRETVAIFRSPPDTKEPFPSLDLSQFVVCQLAAANSNEGSLWSNEAPFGLCYQGERVVVWESGGSEFVACNEGQFLGWRRSCVLDDRFHSVLIPTWLQREFTGHQLNATAVDKWSLDRLRQLSLVLIGPPLQEPDHYQQSSEYSDSDSEPKSPPIRRRLFLLACGLLLAWWGGKESNNQRPFGRACFYSGLGLLFIGNGLLWLSSEPVTWGWWL